MISTFFEAFLRHRLTSTNNSDSKIIQLILVKIYTIIPVPSGPDALQACNDVDMQTNTAIMFDQKSH